MSEAYIPILFTLLLIGGWLWFSFIMLIGNKQQRRIRKLELQISELQLKKELLKEEGRQEELL